MPGFGKQAGMAANHRSQRNRRRGPARWGEIALRLPGGPALVRRMQLQKLLDSWNLAVGTGVAEQTKPKRVRDGVLEVNVSTSVWMQQLQFMKGLILEKLRGQGSPIREIRFFIGEIDGETAGGSTEPAKREFAELEETDKQRIAGEVASIRDTEMRDILYRVFARGLAAEKDRRKR